MKKMYFSLFAILFATISQSVAVLVVRKPYAEQMDDWRRQCLNAIDEYVLKVTKQISSEITELSTEERRLYGEKLKDSLERARLLIKNQQTALKESYNAAAEKIESVSQLIEEAD